MVYSLWIYGCILFSCFKFNQLLFCAFSDFFWLDFCFVSSWLISCCCCVVVVVLPLPPPGLLPGHSPSQQCHTLLLRRPNPCPIASVNGNSYPPSKVLPLHLPPPPPLNPNTQSLPRFSSFGYVPLPISPPSLCTPPLSTAPPPPPLSTSQEQQSQTGTYCSVTLSHR